MISSKFLFNGEEMKLLTAQNFSPSPGFPIKVQEKGEQSRPGGCKNFVTFLVRREMLCVWFWEIIRLTKPSQVPWTGKEPICQVVYISGFRLDTLCEKYNYSSWDLICPHVPKKVEWLGRSMLNIFLKWSTYILYSPFSTGGLSLLQNFQKMEPDRISIFRERLPEKGGDFFE